MPGLVSRRNRGFQDPIADENRSVTKTAAYSMQVYDNLVRCNISGGSFTVTLPPVDECAGLPYTIMVTTDAGSGAAANVVTVKDLGDSKHWGGNQFLRREGQYITFMSQDSHWIVVHKHNGVPASEDKYFHEMFLTGPLMGAIAGGAPSTTLENIMHCGSGLVLSYIPIATQTLHPVWADPGLNIAGDQTASDGWEFTTGLGSGNFRKFVIDTDNPFFVRVRMTIADVTGLAECAVGFRKQAAYAAAIDDYTDMAAFNIQAGVVNLETILNNAATTTTDTTLTDWADAATHTLEVRVDNTGAVTYLYDDAEPTVVAAFTFDSGDTVIPFLHILQSADLSGAVTILEFECGYQN